MTVKTKVDLHLMDSRGNIIKTIDATKNLHNAWVKLMNHMLVVANEYLPETYDAFNSEQKWAIRDIEKAKRSKVTKDDILEFYVLNHSIVWQECRDRQA